MHFKLLLFLSLFISVSSYANYNCEHSLRKDSSPEIELGKVIVDRPMNEGKNEVWGQLYVEKKSKTQIQVIEVGGFVDSSQIFQKANFSIYRSVYDLKGNRLSQDLLCPATTFDNTERELSFEDYGLKIKCKVTR